jgi:hypothetical protein
MANALLSNKLLSLVNKKGKQASEIDPVVFGRKMNLVSKLFGCWHGNISRPFAEGKTAYRSCLRCGARKQFNPETLETKRHYYFPPNVKSARL